VFAVFSLTSLQTFNYGDTDDEVDDEEEDEDEDDELLREAAEMMARLKAGKSIAEESSDDEEEDEEDDNDDEDEEDEEDEELANMKTMQSQPRLVVRLSSMNLGPPPPPVLEALSTEVRWFVNGRIEANGFRLTMTTFRRRPRPRSSLFCPLRSPCRRRRRTLSRSFASFMQCMPLSSCLDDSNQRGGDRHHARAVQAPRRCHGHCASQGTLVFFLLLSHAPV
jgi:hypothetical protein